MDAMGTEMTNGTKHSYTVPCSSVFRDLVEALAKRRGVNVGDMARSVLLVLPLPVISDFPDPGEPPAEDRELVVLKSGPAQGRPWRRKPRLQVRMAPGYSIQNVRKALGLALALEKGELAVHIRNPNEAAAVAAERKASSPVTDEHPSKRERRASDKHAAETIKALEVAKEEIERMRAAISVLAFDPVDGGVNSRAEALYVLGYTPDAWPDARSIRARFRMLATIHHPDSNFGDHLRMSQLNQAMEILRDEL